MWSFQPWNRKKRPASAQVEPPASVHIESLPPSQAINSIRQLRSNYSEENHSTAQTYAHFKPREVPKFTTSREYIRNAPLLTASFQYSREQMEEKLNVKDEEKETQKVVKESSKKDMEAKVQSEKGVVTVKEIATRNKSLSSAKKIPVGKFERSLSYQKFIKKQA